MPFVFRLMDELRKLSAPSSLLPSLLLLFWVTLSVLLLLPAPISAETTDNAQAGASEVLPQSDNAGRSETPPQREESAAPSLPSNEAGAATQHTQDQKQQGEKDAPAEQQDQAAPGPAPAQAVDHPKKTTQAKEQGVADALHAGISSSISATARWLDSFFYDPRYEVEENRSRMIVRFEAFDEEDAHWDLRTRIKIKLVLPQMKKKAHLIIAGDPDEQTEDKAIPGETAAVRPDESKERIASASLGYFIKSEERRNISARLGIRYRQGDVVLFIRPHYRVLYHLNSWDLRFTQEVAWWTDTGWESATIVDLERQFSNQFFFRTSLAGRWYEGRHGYFYSLIFSLIQPLSPQRALHYDWVNNFQTRPDNRLEEVALAVRYRQRLWRDWLFAEIAPQVRFPRDRDFDLVPGILFRLETLFGKYN